MEQPPEQPQTFDTPARDLATKEPITWTAQEYIHPEKNVWWYVFFALAVTALIGIGILFLRSYTFSILVVIMAVALLIYVRRPAKLLTYALSPSQGIYVGERQYPFDDFKAFGLIKDGQNYSVLLLPRKRFGTGLSVFFPEEKGEQIVDILGQQLPMEPMELDVIDKLVRKMRL